MPHTFIPRRRSGQSLVEYALAIILVGLLILAAMSVIGGGIGSTFSEAGAGLSGDDSAGGGGPGDEPAEFVVITPTPSTGAPIEFDGPDSASSWDWDFGDGDSSTVENPSHTYATPGTYVVTLTTNEGESSQAIEVIAPVAPVVGWTTLPAPPEDPFPGMGVDPDYYWDEPFTHYLTTGESLSFTDTSTGTITSRLWEWKLGAGPWTAFSTDANPTLSFATAGNRQIRLTVTGPLGSITETAAEQGFNIALMRVLPPLTIELKNADWIAFGGPNTTPPNAQAPGATETTLTWYDGSTINIMAATSPISGDSPSVRTTCQWFIVDDGLLPNTGSSSAATFWEDGMGNEWISALMSVHYPKNDSGSADDEPEDNFGAISSPRIFTAGTYPVQVTCTNPWTGSAATGADILIVAGP